MKLQNLTVFAVTSDVFFIHTVFSWQIVEWSQEISEMTEHVIHIDRENTFGVWKKCL